MRAALVAIGGLLAAVCGSDRPAPVESAPPPARSVPTEPRPPVEPPPPPWTDDWMLAEATRYLDEPAFRRQMVERTLVNHENQYSAARVSAYGRVDRGWDVLPQWNPEVGTVTRALADELARGGAVALPAGAEPLWDGERPTTMAGWVALGRRVFFEYPLRPEVFAEHALAHPPLAEQTGLMQAADGTFPGLVAFADVDGRQRIGITCALCHTDVVDGEVVEGRARRRFDYGRLRLAYHRDTGVTISDDLARRMATWGPGRADITEDDAEDPVAIVDLWGVRQQTALTQAGTIAHLHPAALAIRSETQILHANRERSRPPRELAWALAMYVYAIEPPPRSSTEPSALAQTGQALFEQRCSGCHANAAYGGEPLPATTVGTEPTLAFGRARGTGLYRPSPLVRVADAGPYLHNGTVSSLRSLLSPERLQPDYQGGARGPGAIAGHRYGTDLAPNDREALLAYLRRL